MEAQNAGTKDWDDAKESARIIASVSSPEIGAQRKRVPFDPSTPDSLGSTGQGRGGAGGGERERERVYRSAVSKVACQVKNYARVCACVREKVVVVTLSVRTLQHIKVPIRYLEGFIKALSRSLEVHIDAHPTTFFFFTQ